MRECRDVSRDTIRGHQSGVSAVAVSPDGSQIASAETGGALCLWNMSSGKQIRAIPGLNPQRSLVFLRNGHTLVIGAGGRTIFWNAQTGKEQFSLPALGDQGAALGVASLALSPDEKRLAVGLHTGRIDIYDLPQRRLLKSVCRHANGNNPNTRDPVNGLAFSPDGKTLASGCSDVVGNNSVSLWDVSQMASDPIASWRFTPQGDNRWGRMNSLAFSPEGKYLVTGGDQVVRVWNLATQKSVELARHGGSITRVTFSPDKQWLATASDDNTIQLFDATGIDAGKQPTHAANFRGHDKGVEAIAFSPDSRTLVSGSQYHTLKRWDVAPSVQPSIQAYNLGSTGRVGPLCYSPDGNLLATGGYQVADILEGKQVRIWDARTRKRITQTPPHVHDFWDSTYMCFAPDSKTVAVASADGTLKLCDAHSGQETATFDGARVAFNVIAFSPDGKWIATGDRNGIFDARQQGYVVRLWDVAARREVAAFVQRQTKGHNGWVLALAFSPDSKTLVSGGGEGELRWWDVVGQKEIEAPMYDADGHTLSRFVHSKDISSVAFSPDGQLLAVGSEDNSASLWKTRTRKLVRFLLADQDFVTSVAFAPDGKTLATAGKNGTVKLWSLALTDLQKNFVLDTVTLRSEHNGIRTLTFAPDEPPEGTIASILQPLHFYTWNSPADDERLIAELLSAITEPLKPRSEEIPLEPVGGAVAPDSPFYARRECDAEFFKALDAGESILLVKGARQIGKTSLLAQGIVHAEESDRRVAVTDFQKYNATQLAAEDSFYRLLANALSRQLKFPYDFANNWDTSFGANISMEDFLRDLLAATDEPVVWFMDEVDKLFTAPFASDFFALVRSWHNSRSTERSGPWRKLTVVIAYATEAHLFIQDLNQSPFNVGRKLNLEDFNLQQTIELNGKYGSPLKSHAETQALYALISGQPYLTRAALDALATNRESLPSLLEHADADEGPFSDHLKRLLIAASRLPEVTDYTRAVLAGSALPHQDAYYRLLSAGIIKQHSDNRVDFRCELYRRYLQRLLA